MDINNSPNGAAGAAANTSATNGLDSHLGQINVIVVGNEKGGAGKSTTAIHLMVALLLEGRKVASFDLDARQGTLTQYLTNRRQYVDKHQQALPCPIHVAMIPSALTTVAEAQEEDRINFETKLAEVLAAGCDTVVIDCPGSDTFLSRLAHSYADTLVTPLNDSFLDFAMLAEVTEESLHNPRPSVYSAMVWEAKKRRAARDGGVIDWIVMRNRLSQLDARNKRDMASAIDHLAKRIGFRVIPGLCERVIFREMFLKGLTLLDLVSIGETLTLSHVTARQELRNVMDAVRLKPRLVAGASSVGQHAPVMAAKAS
ncbi:MAG: ATPase [Alphaproteobacteria bacterium]|nr:ATPase [Alphaproteobacteria bacterium]